MTGAITSRAERFGAAVTLDDDDIADLARTLAACSRMERLSDMEIRTVLLLLKQRGFLRQPPENQTLTLRSEQL